MGEHKSYHEVITGKEAKGRLKKCTRHGYLTRYSEEHKCYVLTVYHAPPNKVKKHFRIDCDNSKKEAYNIHDKNKKFEDIGQLLRYYEHHRIDPSLGSIGTCVTPKDYADQMKGCIIM